jgi:broad specificity phosphatase PhoE
MTNMTTIYFVRHGTYENPQRISPNRMPGFPLAREGIKQIKKVAKYFRDKNITYLYTSPILRTYESSQIIGKLIGIKPEINDLIIEIKSPYQGYKLEYVESVVKNIYSASFHNKNGGESINGVQRRMKKFVLSVVKSHTRENIVVVSHGDPIMFYLMKEIGYKVSGDNKELGWGNYSYIPMGGIIKAEFENNKLLDLKQINF